MKTFLILFVLFLISVLANSQSLIYKIVWKGDSIGYIESKVRHNDNYKIYLLESKAHFSVLIKFELQNDYSAKFVNDTLVQTRTISKLNGNERTNTIVNRKSNKYHVVSDGEEWMLEQDHIDFTISMLYFNEPAGKSEIFSERYGKFLELKNISDKTFELTKPNGRKNIYTYGIEGICQRVEVDNAFTKFYFKLITP